MSVCETWSLRCLKTADDGCYVIDQQLAAGGFVLPCFTHLEIETKQAKKIWTWTPWKCPFKARRFRLKCNKTDKRWLKGHIILWWEVFRDLSGPASEVETSMSGSGWLIRLFVSWMKERPTISDNEALSDFKSTYWSNWPHNICPVD